MTREEVVKGLGTLLTYLVEHPGEDYSTDAEMDALREAIALLRVPEVADVDAARNMVLTWYSTAGNKRDCELLLRALDALAREPATEAILHRKNVRIAALESERKLLLARLVDAAALHLADERTVRNMEARITGLEGDYDSARTVAMQHARRSVTLSAKLARVREVADDWKKRVGTANRGEVLLDCGYNEAWADCLKALDAALADEATPERKG